MARKKIILVIVEGPSDETALGVLLSKIFDPTKVYVHIMHSDITSDLSIKNNNILAYLGNEIKHYANSNHFTNKDFQQIIHIIDTDGTYIDDSLIIEDSSCSKPIYSTYNIRINSISKIKQRNQRKRKNIDKLTNISNLWNIPYQVYYMSCNLVHVLYDKLNCSDREKEDKAYQFAIRYRNDIAGFINFICYSDFSVNSTYLESWKFIKLANEYLKRHTNLGLSFPTD